MTRDPTWTEQRLAEQRRRTDAELWHVDRDLTEPPPVPAWWLWLGISIMLATLVWGLWP
jgi:hypothetical protein